MNVKTALALLRHYAEAIVEGKIDAGKIVSMTDGELAEYDELLAVIRKTELEETERLAGIKE